MRIPSHLTDPALIQQCLHNVPAERPNIGEVLGLLEETRAGIRDEPRRVRGTEWNWYELFRTTPGNQVRNWHNTADTALLPGPIDIYRLTMVHLHMHTAGNVCMQSAASNSECMLAT